MARENKASAHTRSQPGPAGDDLQVPSASAPWLDSLRQLQIVHQPGGEVRRPWEAPGCSALRSASGVRAA